MSRREDFDNALWSDPDFLALTPEARMTYIWSWTNPRCGMAGIYKVSLAQAALETGYSAETVERALVELAGAEFAFYERNVLWVRTRARRLRTKSEQIAKSIRSDLLNVADDHPLKARFLEMYASLPWLRGALGEGRASVTGTSVEAQRISHSEPSSVNLTGGSGEPQPRLHGNGNGSGKKGGAGGNSDEPPEDFPDALRPALPKVVAVLERIASAKGANAVTVAATARAMASYPLRPHVRAAEGMEHWLVHGTGATRRVKDVVGTFRNQLESNWQDQARPGASGSRSSLDIALDLRNRGGAA